MTLTPEQLEIRKKGIGASDAPAILGLSRFSSPYALWLLKTGQIPDEPSGKAAEHGTLLEPVIAKHFQDTSGMKVRRVNETQYDDEYDWMFAHLDRRGRHEELGMVPLEIKWTASHAYQALLREEQIPDEWFVQLQHQIRVMGDDAGILAYWAGNDDGSLLVKRDDKFIENLIIAEAAFWECVTNRKWTGPIDGSAATTEALRKMFGTTEDDELELPAEAKKLFAAYDTAKALEEQGKAQKTEAQNCLRAMLGEHKRGVLLVGDKKRTANRSIFERPYLRTKDFKFEHPRLYSKFSDMKTTDRLDVR